MKSHLLCQGEGFGVVPAGWRVAEPKTALGGRWGPALYPEPLRGCGPPAGPHTGDQGQDPHQPQQEFLNGSQCVSPWTVRDQAGCHCLCPQPPWLLGL